MEIARGVYISRRCAERYSELVIKTALIVPRTEDNSIFVSEMDYSGPPELLIDVVGKQAEKFLKRRYKRASLEQAEFLLMNLRQKRRGADKKMRRLVDAKIKVLEDAMQDYSSK